MRKHTHILITVLLAIATTITAGAQENLRTGYFLDGYNRAYKMNPALQIERGFFTFIPNVGVGVESNLGLGTILYPTESGNLTTFMNESVLSEDFLSKLNNNNLINVNANVDIISIGFWSKKSYHTLDLGVHAGVGVSLPKELFQFAKVGSADGTTHFDLSNLGVQADARLEAAYGFSTSIKNVMTIGFRAKFLMGLAHANANISNMQLDASGEQWRIKGNGTLDVSFPGLRLLTNEESGTAATPQENDYLSWQFETPTGQDIMDGYLKHPKSFGGAIDFGMNFNLGKYVNLSMSVCDLGVMSWGNLTQAAMPDSEEGWVFNGFDNMAFNDPSFNLGDQFTALGNDLKNTVNFKRLREGASKVKMLAPITYLGLQAKMPFYDRMSIGVLGTRRFDKQYSFTEVRASLNWALLRWLSLSANYAYSDLGHSFGGALNIHCKGFNLYVGSDSFWPLFKVTPQYIPVYNANTNVAVGIVFACGKYHGPYPKKIKNKTVQDVLDETELTEFEQASLEDLEVTDHVKQSQESTNQSKETKKQSKKQKKQEKVAEIPVKIV